MDGEQPVKRKPGRPKGSLNTKTIVAKEAIELAMQALGGYERLAAWASESPENERVFWGSIFVKLLPVQMTGSNGAPLIPPRIQFVRDPD